MGEEEVLPHPVVEVRGAAQRRDQRAALPAAGGGERGGAGGQPEAEEIAAAGTIGAIGDQSWLGNLPRYQPVIIARSEAGSTRKTRATWTKMKATKIQTAQKCQ